MELKKLCRGLFFRVEERRKWPEHLAALESLLNHSTIFLKYECWGAGACGGQFLGEAKP